MTLQIKLPESLERFVEAEVAEGAYGSAEEYVHQLIRADQKRKAREKIEALLLEGLNSGEPTPFTPKDWNELRESAKQRSRAGAVCPDHIADGR
jgi:antitoxin ParD1/3/4